MSWTVACPGCGQWAKDSSGVFPFCDVIMDGDADAVFADLFVCPCGEYLAMLRDREVSWWRRAHFRTSLNGDCRCGYPSTRTLHTGGADCPRGEVSR